MSDASNAEDNLKIIFQTIRCETLKILLQSYTNEMIMEIQSFRKKPPQTHHSSYSNLINLNDTRTKRQSGNECQGVIQLK